MRGSHKRRWQGLMLGVGACLVAGLAASVGVAWSLALSKEFPLTYTHRVRLNIAPPGEQVWIESVDFSDSYRPGFEMGAMRNNGSRVVVDRRLAEQAVEYVGTIRHVENMRRRNEDLSHYKYPPRDPVWAAWVMRPEGDEQYVELWGRAAGWPWLCLSHRGGVKADGTVVSVGGLRLLDFARYSRWGHTDVHLGEVPLLPVWRGLVLNTLVYAGAAFVGVMLPVVGVVRWRRVRRRRRGLCELCGYELGEKDVCPECGEALKAES